MMSRKRKLIFGLASVLVLAFVAIGTMLAITRKSTPDVLSGLNAEVISKESAFYQDPMSGKMQQMTMISLKDVDREALLRNVEHQQKKFPGRVSFFYPAGEDTILVEMGPAKLPDYWLAYVTTFGKPPRQAQAITRQGKTVFSVSGGKGGTAFTATSPALAGTPSSKIGVRNSP